MQLTQEEIKELEKQLSCPEGKLGVEVGKNNKITGANSRIKKTFKQQIINFCGMKLISFNIYGGLDKSNINTEKILEKIVL
ncbi:hypothetical protein [Tenacibaculum mesophilum]|uniref:hypothetical protein n=1 Tax=Tenacibaculum mesophilum TaxID=104268 RepID=UPI0037495FAA